MRLAGYSSYLRRGKGSYMLLQHETRRPLTVPQTIGTGLLRQMLKDAGISREEFVRLLSGKKLASDRGAK